MQPARPDARRLAEHAECFGYAGGVDDPAELVGEDHVEVRVGVAGLAPLGKLPLAVPLELLDCLVVERDATISAVAIAELYGFLRDRRLMLWGRGRRRRSSLFC
jgi:hypothetical protein